MSSNLAKLAKLFADRTNPFYINVTTGTVISASPLKIQFGDSIVLDDTHLVVAAYLLSGYQRQIEIDSAVISTLAAATGTATMTPSGGTATDYTISNLSVPDTTASKITATMTYTDTLNEGDEVILIPDNDFVKWYVFDKAVTFS